MESEEAVEKDNAVEAAEKWAVLDLDAARYLMCRKIASARSAVPSYRINEEFLVFKHNVPTAAR